jgi:hypothetical protein
MSLPSLGESLASVSNEGKRGSDSWSQFVANVTACLQECKNCTGMYVDFSRKYRVRCLCKCHKSTPTGKAIA